MRAHARGVRARVRTSVAGFELAASEIATNSVALRRRRSGRHLPRAGRTRVGFVCRELASTTGRIETSRVCRADCVRRAGIDERIRAVARAAALPIWCRDPLRARRGTVVRRSAAPEPRLRRPDGLRRTGTASDPTTVRCGQGHDEPGAAAGPGLGARAAAHRRRELAHDREPEPGADRTRPGRLAHGVEPLEHAGRSGRPGSRGRRRRRRPRPGRRSGVAAYTSTLRGGVLQRVLDEVGDDLREPFGVEVDRERARRSTMFSAMPSSRACGANASAASRTTSVASHGPRVQRELVGVEAGEVEQIADEPFEAAALGADDRRGPLAFVRDRRRRGCRRRAPPRSRGST